MPKISVESANLVEDETKIQSGDLVLIDGDAFIVAYTNSEGLELIKLADGNRWTFGSLKEKSSESVLQEYVGEGFNVKLIKSRKYAINLMI